MRLSAWLAVWLSCQASLGQNFAGHLPVQRPQETDDLGALDRAGRQLEVEVAQCQPGDRRDAFPI